MSDVGARIMGGMTKAEARRVLGLGVGDGGQSVVPGAERISTGELLQRRADGPAVHAPAAKQKPADGGLFDVAGRKQKELF